MVTETLAYEEIDTSIDFYRREEVFGFMATRDDCNLLSTFTPGTPLKVNGITFKTPEGLYQAFKFSNSPSLQKIIGEQDYGTDAKEKAEFMEEMRPKDLRPDWEAMRVPAMVYTMAITLRSRPEFAEALLETGEKPIVQISIKDPFWGAQPDPDRIVLVGRNALGKILTEMRDELRWRMGDVPATARKFSTEIPRGRLLINSRTVQPLRAA